MARPRGETSTEYGRPFRAAPLAVANRLGATLERVGVRPVSLAEASLFAAAERATGLCRLGDEPYRVPMRKLLAALEEEARLNLVGRVVARGNLVRVLSNRLRIDAELDRRPEILAAPLEPPVVIVGLQRTGTTVLHRLLAEDPAFRFLPSWEALNPAPGARRANGHEDPRVRFARLAERSVTVLGPDFYAIHPVQATSPEEDCLLMDLTFMSQTAEATQQVPSYAAWLEEQDHGEAYRYFEKVLKYLQWVGPKGRWLLKTPAHLEHLDALLEVFPGARVLFTHRDPTRCIASFCSMMAHAYGMFTDEVDPRVVGARWLRKDALMMRRALEARDRAGEGQFLDVSYYDLVRDPLAEVRRVYGWLGVELTREVEARMAAWGRANPQHKHGRHRYGLGAFGLDAAEVEAAFDGYRERFAIPHE